MLTLDQLIAAALAARKHSPLGGETLAHLCETDREYMEVTYAALETEIESPEDGAVFLVCINKPPGRYRPPQLNVYDLGETIRALGSAVAIMQPEDVLSNFGVGEGAVDETAEGYQPRLDAAAKWLTENRTMIEEAMVKAGFEAMAFATPPAGIYPKTLDNARDSFELNPSEETAKRLRDAANEYYNDGIIEEDTRDDYLKQTGPYLDNDALTAAAMRYKDSPELHAAIINRRDNPSDASATAMRVVAQNLREAGYIPEQQMWDLIAFSEIEG